MGDSGSGPILVNEQLCARRTHSFCQILTVIADFRIIQILPDGQASIMFELVFFVPALHTVLPNFADTPLNGKFDVLSH